MMLYCISAFHEAIGEAIGLSVGTPKHLQALGLMPNSITRKSVDINFLYRMALDKVVFLPFAYVIGKERYNCHWHLLRYIIVINHYFFISR